MGARQNKRDADGMTDLERRFAMYYLESFNATEAYLQASAKPKGGANRKTAESNGYRLLQRPHIQAFIKKERDRLMDRAELTVDNVLAKLREMVMYDPRKFFKEDGTLKQVTELGDAEAFALTSMEVDELFAGSGQDKVSIGVTKKIKMADRLTALEKAMKYHGLFEKDNSQNTKALKDLLEHGVTFKIIKPDAPAAD